MPREHETIEDINHNSDISPCHWLRLLKLPIDFVSIRKDLDPIHRYDSVFSDKLGNPTRFIHAITDRCVNDVGVWWYYLGGERIMSVPLMWDCVHFTETTVRPAFILKMPWCETTEYLERKFPDAPVVAWAEFNARDFIRYDVSENTGKPVRAFMDLKVGDVIQYGGSDIIAVMEVNGTALYGITVHNRFGGPPIFWDGRKDSCRQWFFDRVFRVVGTNIDVIQVEKVQTIEVNHLRCGDLVASSDKVSIISSVKRRLGLTQVLAIPLSVIASKESVFQLENYKGTPYNVTHTVKSFGSIPVPISEPSINVCGLKIFVGCLNAPEVDTLKTIFTPSVCARLVSLGITEYDPLNLDRLVKPVSIAPKNTMLSYPAYCSKIADIPLEIKLAAFDNVYTPPFYNITNGAFGVDDENDYYLLLKIQNSTASYLPQTNTILLSSIPIELDASTAEWFSDYLDICITQVEAWNQEVATGKFDKLRFKRRVNKILDRAFGLTVDDVGSSIIVGPTAIHVRVAGMGEVPTHTLKTPHGEIGFIETGKQLQVTPLLDELVSGAISIEDASKDAANETINSLVDNLLSQMLTKVVTPTIDRVRKTQDVAMLEISTARNTLESLSSEARINYGDIVKSMEQMSSIIDFAEGLLESIAPKGWYVRVSSDGYFEICLDECNATTKKGITVKSLPLIRVRVFWDTDDKKWKRVIYSESLVANATRVPANPHVEWLRDGRSDKLQRLFGLPYEACRVCFGGSNPPTDPAHASLIPFAKRLAEWLVQVDRVCRNWDESHSPNKEAYVSSAIALGLAEGNAVAAARYDGGADAGIISQCAAVTIEYAKNHMIPVEVRAKEVIAKV